VVQKEGVMFWNNNSCAWCRATIGQAAEREIEVGGESLHFHSGYCFEQFKKWKKDHHKLFALHLKKREERRNQ